MADLHEIDVGDRRRREGRVWRSGIVISLILHVLLFFVWSGDVIPPSPFAAAGPRAGDNRAAAGGMQAINVPTPVTTPIIPPPRPIEVAVEVEPVEFDQRFEENAEGIPRARLQMFVLLENAEPGEYDLVLKISDNVSGENLEHKEHFEIK